MTRAHLIFMLAAALVLSAPGAAWAQLVGVPLMDACAPGLPSWALTGKVVACVQNTIVMAVQSFMIILSDNLRFPVGVFFTLTVMMFGFRILGGEKELLPTAAGFLIRLSLVMAFTLYLPAFASVPFQITEEAINWVVGGWSAWMQIDSAVGRLLGFGPALSLFQGVIGLIGAALFSSGVGMFLFLFGFVMVLMLLGLVYRAVYTYLLAIVLMALLMCVAPLLVPLAIMRATEHYFKEWFKMLLSTMLMPVLLMAFMWSFLALLDITVDSVFTLLGGNNFLEYMRTNVPLFSWILVTDPELLRPFEQAGAGAAAAAPPVQAFMNPGLGRGMDMNLFQLPQLDFGPNSMARFQELIGTFASTIVVLIMMRSMIDAIPRLSDQIAGASTGISFEQLPFMSTLKNALKTISMPGQGGT